MIIAEDQIQTENAVPKNTVIHGDCLNVMPFIPDESVDFILCDLPYGTLDASVKWDEVIPFNKLWEQYLRIIKFNGAICLFGSQPFTTKLISSNIDMFRYELIWKKSSCGNWQMSKKMPLKKHENICIFYNKLPTYNPQMVPAPPQTIARRKRNFTKRPPSENGLNHMHGKDGQYFLPNYEGRDLTLSYPDTILEFDDGRKKIAPTQKPVSLCEWLIKTYSNEGEIVLDNCAGSFTTAIACMNTKRNWICIEKEEKYAKLGHERITSHQIQSSTDPL